MSADDLSRRNFCAPFLLHLKQGPFPMSARENFKKAKYLLIWPGRPNNPALFVFTAKA
jgi:hypothetical protein